MKNVFFAENPAKCGIFYWKIFITLTNEKRLRNKQETVNRFLKRKQSESINNKPPTKSKNKNHFAQSGSKSFLNVMQLADY